MSGEAGGGYYYPDSKEESGDLVMDCPFREECARKGGICQCAEEQQADDEARRRSELGDDW